ncbi:glycosyltransferase family 2 protein [Alkalibacterium pelagium]|uniref:Glycosyl transferase family 2 n=1 Tax=Alkalibacterium pelagium TaxID=426702 RepID=A0A1H7NN88_9LACT|nr:glycosyltransferase family A protein [Alkalibacterium pelagium]GEN51437.1 glycosyl transferase [Alkalibacterium pelagium]SEL24478.1 Glycosyl transferase family 2 [Alkalibacterium pelagium]
MISVVIPTHNRSELLTRAVESALNQTHKDIEIIVVSDGSTDNTEEVMKAYQQRENNIKFISVFPGKGANNARNEGIRASEGEYIAFLDDDDEWAPHKLESQLSVFNSDSSIGMVYTGINVIYVKEDLTYYSLSGKGGDLSKDILLKNVIGATPSVMIKKEILDQSGFFDVDMPAKQDYDLWIRVCQLTNVGYVDEPLVNYYNYSGEKQISLSTEKHERAIEMIDKKYSSLFKTLTPEEVKQQRSNYFISIANIALRNNNKSLGFKYGMKALHKKISLKNLVYVLSVPIPFKVLLKVKNRM